MPEDVLFTDEVQENEPYPPITAPEREVFTTPSDPDVETLVTRIEDGSLVLRPKFQRASVWTVEQKSRLIESLLLNLPIPPVFFAEDSDGNRVVVDGQQRLNSIDDFYHGRFALKGLQVLSDLNGKYWRDLPPKLDRKILQRVIRTLVISHHTPSDIQFEIFERLNTGGAPLTQQEIRNATVSGPFNDLLDELAHSGPFLQAIRRREPDPRLSHHEIILRFFALYESLPRYETPLKHYLTDYMKARRRLSASEANRLRHVFADALNCCLLVFGDNPFRRLRVDETGRAAFETVVNRAVFDVQMLGFADVNLQSVSNRGQEIVDAFIGLSARNERFVEYLSRATDHRSRLVGRLRTWFQELGVLQISVPLMARLPQE